MKRLDLNLVRVFAAIFETRSVTAAAERLSVTQPTVSYSLAKLRDAYGDRLFVRGPGGLKPTLVAEEIYRSFDTALRHIDGTLEDVHHFDPGSTTRRFRVATSDVGALYFAPLLLARFQHSAPRIELEIVEVVVDQTLDDLTTGRLDAAIGSLPSIRPHTHSVALFRDRYVCLMANNHPAIHDTLALPDFLAARHVLVTSPFASHRMVDDLLGERGLSRRIAVRVPHFSALPHLLGQSDLLGTLPSRPAQLFAAQGMLKCLDIPLPMPEYEVRLHWNPRRDNHPAMNWFRGEVEAALRSG